MKIIDLNTNHPYRHLSILSQKQVRARDGKTYVEITYKTEESLFSRFLSTVSLIFQGIEKGGLPLFSKDYLALIGDTASGCETVYARIRPKHRFKDLKSIKSALEELCSSGRSWLNSKDKEVLADLFAFLSSPAWQALVDQEMQTRKGRVELFEIQIAVNNLRQLFGVNSIKEPLLTAEQLDRIYEKDVLPGLEKQEDLLYLLPELKILQETLPNPHLQQLIFI
jgi:hypothetical protein